MGASKSERNIRVGDISNVSGNVAVGRGNNQVQNLPGEASPADQIRQLVDQIRSELGQRTRLPGKPDAEEALTEIDEAIADGPVPSRPQRLDRASQKLMRALKGVTEFAAPLAQLTAAIAQLLGRP
jgi:hypothetical protein